MLRDISEDMTFNRKGVGNMHLEYMWTVEIDVESGDETESERLEYTFATFYAASRVCRQTRHQPQPAHSTTQFNAELWKNKHFPEKNETHWIDVLPSIPV